MKILLIHNYYRNRGGEDVVFDYQKELLVEKGYEVIEYSKKSTEVNNLFKKVSAALGFFYSFKTYREIKKIIFKDKPDIAHIHNIFPVISQSVYDVLYNNNIPIVQTIHNYRFFCSNGLCLNRGKICTRCETLSVKNIFNNCSPEKKFYNFLMALNIYIIRKRNVYSKIDHFVALSNFVKDKLVRVGIEENRITVIRNSLKECDTGINISSSDKLRSKKYFVYIGRLSQEKGILELINVFSSLKNIELKILGDGPLYKEIYNRIYSGKVNNIELLGFVDGKEKYRVLHSAYAMVIPSICFEVSPLVIIESFSLGIPVIVNNIGSLPEFIEDGENGYIYNDSYELREIILKMVSLSEMKASSMADECKESYKRLFSKDINFNSLVNLYELILKRRLKK